MYLYRKILIHIIYRMIAQNNPKNESEFNTCDDFELINDNLFKIFPFFYLILYEKLETIR